MSRKWGADGLEMRRLGGEDKDMRKRVGDLVFGITDKHTIFLLLYV